MYPSSKNDNHHPIVQWIFGHIHYSILSRSPIPFYVAWVVRVHPYEMNSRERRKKKQIKSTDEKKISLREIKLAIKVIKSNVIKTKRQIFSLYLSIVR